MFIFILNENQFSNFELNFQYWNNNNYFFNLRNKEEDFQEKVAVILDRYLL